MVKFLCGKINGLGTEGNTLHHQNPSHLGNFKAFGATEVALDLIPVIPGYTIQCLSRTAVLAVITVGAG